MLITTGMTAKSISMLQELFTLGKLLSPTELSPFQKAKLPPWFYEDVFSVSGDSFVKADGSGGRTMTN